MAWVAYNSEETGLVIGRSLEEARRYGLQERAAMEKRFRSAPFPLYGLPSSWSGMRCLGRGMFSSGGTHALSLVHGVPVEGVGPMLVVETGVPGSGGGGSPLRTLAEHLWRRPGSTVADAVAEVAACWPGTESDIGPLPLEQETVVSVDGIPTSFSLLAQPVRWVGRAVLGEYLVTLQGQDFASDSLELVRITDVEPYIQGLRQFEETPWQGAAGD